MTRVSRLLALVGTALVLAACAGGNPVTVGVPDIARIYSPLELSAYGSGGNALRVEVYGDPFGAGAAATAAATVAAMQGRTFGTPVTFALAPQQERKPLSRVVVYFNPRPFVGAEGLCNPDGPVATAPSRDGTLRMAAAWCQTNFSLSETSGHVAGATGLDGEPFRALVGQVTTAMFPPRNPHEQSRRGCPPYCSR